jgi:AcrR family transcriptional regulator
VPTSVEAGRRGPRRDATANREALLAAAAATLAESADASLEAIARNAGLSRRAVYGHFANRDELVHALIERGAERLNRTAAAVDHEDPLVAIALLGARLWDTVEHVRLLAAMAVREPYVHGVAAALAPVRARLCGLVGRAAALGAGRRDVPEQLLTRLIEQAALAVLIETAAPSAGEPTADARIDTRTRPDPAAAVGPATDPTTATGSATDPRRLVMLVVLGTAGLSWRESGALIDATPELAPATSERTDTAAGTTGTAHAPTDEEGPRP